MNRLLLTADEVADDGEVALEGRRARHLVRVLGVKPGDTVRAGLIDGPAGDAVVTEVRGADALRLRCEFAESAGPAPLVDLLLALPRPKVMKRLWAPLASMGVRRIILCNAAKVERQYFDTHWLDAAFYRPLLIEGLEQSGDTAVPLVTLHRRFRPLVEDELAALSPRARRIVLHPRGAVPLARVEWSPAELVLAAVGPEGGWTQFELDLLAANGFTAVSLGWRTLRSDTACMAALAAVEAVRSSRSGSLPQLARADE